MSDPWTYAVTPPARRDLRRLDPPVQRRITEALDRFVANPFAGDIRRLNTIEWRLRVGDWRVRFAFEEEQRVIVVLRVLPAVGPMNADGRRGAAYCGSTSTE